jgi:FKBP-type peptidyl-prolyl cis-trans isomerase
MEEFKELFEDRGLYKKILKEGLEVLPDKIRKPSVNYKIILEDGSLVEEKIDEIFDLDDESKILGLRLGIKTMKKGEKSIFVMRYDYGYGEFPTGNQKKFMSVIACVDLIDFN